MFVLKNPSCDYIPFDDKIVIVDNTQRKYLIFNKDNQELFEKIFTKLEVFNIDTDFSKKEIEKLEVLHSKGLVRYSNTLYFQPLDEAPEQGRFETQKLYFSNFGVEAQNFQNQLENRKICIIGAGALGSTLAVKFSAMGIKNITVIDDDVVELDNLTRQIFYTPQQARIKTKKVDALKEFITNFYPESQINVLKHFLTCIEDIYRVIPRDIDLLINTADSPRGLLDDWVNEFSIENEVATIYTHHKSVGPLYIPNKGGACIKCFEQYFNNKTQGLYSEIKSKQNNLPNTKNASFVAGTLMNEVIVFKMVLAHFLNDNVEYFQNKIFTFYDSEFEIKTIKIEKAQNCLCDKREITQNGQMV